MSDKNEENMMFSIETDALRETYGLRVPEITHREILKLSPAQKKQLNEELLKAIDRVLHNFSYVPGKHLKEQL